MKHYTYLIVGGGMTAYAAIMGIHEVDEKGSIGLFGMETHRPYTRPPLTKSLWKGKPLDRIWLRDIPEKQSTLHLGVRINSINTVEKQVADDLGNTYSYDKLLLATGGKIRQLTYDNDLILYYRTLDDYQHLRTLTSRGKKFAVMGGGFIGAEIAAALSMFGEKVAMVFPEDGIGARIFPADLSEYITNYYREKNVEVFKGIQVTNIRKDKGQAVLLTDQDELMRADLVIAGIGIAPDTDLAIQAGIKLSNGIEVDESLRTSQPDIYSAGDVASFYNPALTAHMRVEHVDNALTMGKAAGRNMAHAFKNEPAEPYHHLPYFYSDLFDLGYEAVGKLDSSLETFSDWQEPFKKGVVYYLKDNRVRGVLLWNVWEKVEKARALVAEAGPITVADLKKRRPIV